MTSTVTYLGDLRTECTHNASKNRMITDAPLDNQGKGEAFSPTDQVATALASCMLTIMGIKARDLGIDLKGTRAEVKKTMGNAPRRIIKIAVTLHFSNIEDHKTQKILQKAAETCPVHYSLHPYIDIEVTYHWG